VSADGDAARPAITAEAAEHASRLARFRAAQERIAKIVDGSPPLTEDQRQTLVLLLWPATVRR
jgi:hypothetical protein